MQPSNKIMIMAGGTGGHVFPALAVAERLEKKGFNIFWLGTKYGIEKKILAGHGYPFFTVSVSGVRGKGSISWLLLPFRSFFAIVQSLYILLKVRPNVVLGMGGFVSGPGGIAAFLSGIPLLIHEQNTVAGTTNRLLSPFARVIMEAFPGTFSRKKKLIFSGNPVRDDIVNIHDTANKHLWRTENTQLNLLVLGGSQGAERLNHIMPETVARIDFGDDDSRKINVVHQTGVKHIATTRRQYSSFDVSAKLLPFIVDMAKAYAWADIVVCRSGAMTISELAAVGRGSILIPFPYASDDHQTSNAHYLSDRGAAILIQEKELTVDYLVEALVEVMEERRKLVKMAKKAHAASKIDAVDIVAKECMRYGHVHH